jgi:uncharacterized protein (TIGR02271 family)
MTTRTVTAMFNSRPNAERAAEQLQSQLNLTRGSVRLSPEIGTTDTGYDKSAPYQETGFFASLKNMFLPDEDRYAYAEGMRRGNVLVSAQVDESEINRAADLLEHAGAVDLDQEEASWRKSGWTGYDASRHAATPAAAATTSAPGASATSTGAATTGVTAAGMTGAAARSATATGTAATARDSVAGAAAGVAGAATGRDEFIPVVEERLVVGKREVDRGRVRVRSYVVERPVEAEVRLHEERVEVERRPVDRALSEADRAAAFQERVIEASATAEEAVIGKEARVVEEIAVHKEATDRTETVHDTVRRTEVEVEDTAAGQRATGPGTAAGATARGTGAAGTVDRALGTNVSGTNPAAHAPDGTPGNPPGTMASRAVDKALGTNISGANPSNKT